MEESAGLEVSGSRGATEMIPHWRGFPRTGQAPKLLGEPVRDRNWARHSAVVGRKGDGKEPVRCRNGPRHGPSYRQHRGPGIRGAVGDSLGDEKRDALPRMRHLESGPRGWGLDSVREVGTGSAGRAAFHRGHPLAAYGRRLLTPPRGLRERQGGWKCPILTSLLPERRRAPGFTRGDGLGNLTIAQMQGGAQGTSMALDPKEVSTNLFRIWDDGARGLNSRQEGCISLNPPMEGVRAGHHWDRS